LKSVAVNDVSRVFLADDVLVEREADLDGDERVDLDGVVLRFVAFFLEGGGLFFPAEKYGVEDLDAGTGDFELRFSCHAFALAFASAFCSALLFFLGAGFTSSSLFPVASSAFLFRLGGILAHEFVH